MDNNVMAQQQMGWRCCGQINSFERKSHKRATMMRTDRVKWDRIELKQGNKHHMLMLGDNIVPRKPAARCTPIGLSQSVNQPVHHLVERRRLSEVSSGRVWLRHGPARRLRGVAARLVAGGRRCDGWLRGQNDKRDTQSWTLG